MGSTYTLVDKRRWPGVYQYASGERRHQGRPDELLVIAYKLDGKLKWEKIGWKSEGYTPQVASEIRSERLKSARHGEKVLTHKEIRREKARTDRTIDELAKAYFEAKGDSLKGRRTDLNRYDLHLKPLVGQFSASKLSPLDIARIKKSLDGRAPATIWNTLELLRRIVNFGVKTKMAPALGFVIDMPDKDNEVVEYLEPEQAARFLEVLDAWPSLDVARMLKLAMFSGLRRSEVFKLQDRDLDFHQGLITIRKPKGGKTVSVPMNSIARTIIEDQITWRNEHYQGSTYLFPGRKGALRVDSKAVDRIKVAADLPKDFRIFHGLRHHYAVALANSGQFSIDMIAELLTHKSTAMTKRYGQFLPDTMKKAGDLAASIVREQAALSKPKKVSIIR